MRLAILTTHPVQYYAPWFRHLAAEGGIELRVFYLSDFGIRTQIDPKFARPILWDVPLLEGYESEFVPNVSTDPGTHHFRGLRNPELPERIRKWKPDAALLIGYNYQSLLNFLRQAGPLPLIFRGDSHDLENPDPAIRRWVKTQLRRRIFSRFRAFLPVGSANREYFRRHGIPDHRLFSAPHAVDNERFAREATPAAGLAWRQEHGLPAGERVILFAGKFEPKKRPDLLLRSFAGLNPERTRLVFVGGGELEATLRRDAADGKTRFVSFQNQSQMPAAYAAADVVVLPSEGNRETWGLAVNEAMASSRPVIVSSAVGCAADLVIPGRTGWTFPSGNGTALTECLRAALNDDAHRMEMGRQAQRHVSEHFSYARTSAGLLAALNAIRSGAC